METTVAPPISSHVSPQTRQRLWPAILSLFVLAALIPESIAGYHTSPRAMLLNPAIPLFFMAFYGSAALLMRELMRRRSLGWTSILLLGAAFGCINEGIIAGTWYTVIPRGYARLGAVDWTWAVALTCFYAIYSMVIPILLVEVCFPSLSKQPWLRRRGLLCCTALLTLTTGMGLLHAQADRLERLLVLLLVVALVSLALLLPSSHSSRPRTPRATPRLGWLRLAGGVGITLFISISFLVPSLLDQAMTSATQRVFQTLFILLILAVCGLMLTIVRNWTGRNTWGHPHTLALITGALLPAILLSLVLPQTWLAAQPAVTFPFLVFLIWLTWHTRALAHRGRNEQTDFPGYQESRDALCDAHHGRKVSHVQRIVRIMLLSQVASFASLTGCSGPGGMGHPSAATPQMVFMMPTNGRVFPPGPENISWEIVVMNLDGSGRRQLTSDGKFKFLPHFSPDGSKIVYTKYAVGGYGDPNAQTDVFVYDLATAQETQLTHSGIAVQPVWSPDGQRIAYLSSRNGSLWIMKADGSHPMVLGQPSGALDDLTWGDLAWSSDDWILFSVAQNTNNCFKVRLDKIRPDGTARTQVTDGGPNCTPTGMEQSGDADPGFSADGKTIFSSRGFPVPPADTPSGTERKLFAFSSDAWFPGKPETDLSLPSEPSCIEGVPKGSPDGKQILLFRICFDTGSPKGGIYLTDTAGSYRTFITQGFGPDWNPAWKP